MAINTSSRTNHNQFPFLAAGTGGSGEVNGIGIAGGAGGIGDSGTAGVADKAGMGVAEPIEGAAAGITKEGNGETGSTGVGAKIGAAARVGGEETGSGVNAGAGTTGATGSGGKDWLFPCSASARTLVGSAMD
jgi:hypothetical protein